MDLKKALNALISYGGMSYALNKFVLLSGVSPIVVTMRKIIS